MTEAGKFADALLTTIKTVLSSIGVPEGVLKKLDEWIFLVLIVLIALLVGRLIRWITERAVNKILKFKKASILQSLVEYKAIKKISFVVPPLIVAALLPFAFAQNSHWLNISEKITWIYFVVVLVVSANVVLSSVGKVVLTKGEMHNRPMKGFIQILQVLFSFIGFILVVSIFINKSPLNLITGLGAFAAVLMLIFKDTILGFVAGVLLSQNDMIRIGDWIEMDSNKVNGIVMDISLNIVKVRNFDNTIVTIPPYALISGSFINWRGMADSGGRRIMRSYDLKVDTIQPCTPAFLEEMKKIPLLTDYITKKQEQQIAGKVANTDNPEGLANGSIETNAGLFRAYMTLYLQQHTFINTGLILMVRTLAPNANGLPLQVYCFSSNKNWVSYESIQAEIMEHFTYMLPKFGLFPFQNASSRDYINSGIIEAGGKAAEINGLPWQTYKEQPQNSDRS